MTISQVVVEQKETELDELSCEVYEMEQENLALAGRIAELERELDAVEELCARLERMVAEMTDGQSFSK